MSDDQFNHLLSKLLGPPGARHVFDGQLAGHAADLGVPAPHGGILGAQEGRNVKAPSGPPILVALESLSRQQYDTEELLSQLTGRLAYVMRELEPCAPSIYTDEPRPGNSDMVHRLCNAGERQNGFNSQIRELLRRLELPDPTDAQCAKACTGTLGKH